MSKISIYTPETTPNELVERKNSKHEFKVFLAGTIDDGNSTDWQSKVIEQVKGAMTYDISIYNPRRKSWDPKARQDEVMQQIDWEQRALSIADHIYMVLLDNSKSPISLLELGLFARTRKITVFCTPNFYRYFNVLDTCHRHNLEIVNSTDPGVIARRITRNAKDFEILESYTT